MDPNKEHGMSITTERPDVTDEEVEAFMLGAGYGPTPFVTEDDETILNVRKGLERMLALREENAASADWGDYGPHNDPPTPEHGLDYVDSENVPICYCGVQWSEEGCEAQQDSEPLVTDGEVDAAYTRWSAEAEALGMGRSDTTVGRGAIRAALESAARVRAIPICDDCGLPLVGLNACDCVEG